MQNRIYEIRQLIPPIHCSGRDNPADLPSRGLTPRELAESQLWKNGLDWLREIELSCAEVDARRMQERDEDQHGPDVAQSIGKINSARHWASNEV